MQQRLRSYTKSWVLEDAPKATEPVPGDTGLWTGRTHPGDQRQVGSQDVRLEDPSFPLWLGLLQLDPTVLHHGLTLSLSSTILAGRGSPLSLQFKLYLILFFLNFLSVRTSGGDLTWQRELYQCNLVEDWMREDPGVLAWLNAITRS